MTGWTHETRDIDGRLVTVPRYDPGPSDEDGFRDSDRRGDGKTNERETDR